MKQLSFPVKSYGITDVGLVRDKNEDVFALVEEEYLYVLADGMGGHRSGDVAARAAVHALCAILKDVIEQQSDLNTSKLIVKMDEAFAEVNRITYNLAQQDPYLKGMGTTLLCLHLREHHAIFGHVGDSRIYRLRNKKLELLTQDHSLLRELMEMGQLDQKKAENFMYKNILTRAIGTEPTVEPTVQCADLEPGDLFLLCSDGLTDTLSHQEIQTHLLYYQDLHELGNMLVKQAKEKGGPDNITLVLIRTGSMT